MSSGTITISGLSSSTQAPICKHAIGWGFFSVTPSEYAGGSFAALLTPAGEAALKLMGEPCYVIWSNLAVRARRQGREVFVWKEKSVEATAELLHEFEKFASDVGELLPR